MAATAALVLILALPAIAPHGVDATSVVATNHGKPEFKEGDFTVRTVPEGTPSGRDIGNPVSATDPENDTLTYLLGGMDASLFEIVTASGQLQTKANLDQQLKTSFEVLVGVHGNHPDPSIDDRITVTINVVTGTLQQNGGGLGFGPAPVAPKFTDGFRTQREVAENSQPGDAVGDAVDASHPDGLGITYSLSGANASLFTVDEDTGQIRVREGAALVLGKTYTINLTATDTSGTGAIIIVDIVVTEALYHEYDTNRNGRIDRDEVLEAVSDYFAGDIDKEEVIDLVKLYYQDA